MGVQVPFGLRAGRLYEPLQVPLGLACGCVCPGCGDALVAKHAPAGKVRPHFAHTAQSSCAGGLESAIHLAVKQLIEDRRELYMPALVDEVSAMGALRHRTRTGTARPGGLTSLTEVRQEQPVGAIRPDLLVHTGNEQVMVEVAFTHFVDVNKLDLIRRLNIPALEVDVSDLVVPDFDQLARRLFTPSMKVKWLFHPVLVALRAELMALLAADLKDDAQLKAARDAADAATLRAQRESEQTRLLKQRQATAEKAAKFAALPDAEKLRRVFRSMESENSSPPAFLMHRVRAAGSVAATPRVWQPCVFAAFVHRRQSPIEVSVTVDDVVRWLATWFGLDRSRGKPEVAVYDFLAHLADMRILRKHRGTTFLVQAASYAAAVALVANAGEGWRRDLSWTSTWPPSDRVYLVAEAFAFGHGQRELWMQLTELPEHVRDEDPMDVLIRHMRHGVGAAEVREFLLAAGYATVS